MKRLFLLLSLAAAFSLSAVLFCQASEQGACSFISDNSVYFGSGAIQIGIFSVAMFFLWRGGLRETMDSVGFPGELKSVAFYTFISLSAITLVLTILSAAALLMDFDDQEKVLEKVVGLPIIILLLAAFAAPVFEELFFRALLVPRLGVLGSSLIFGLVHFTYGSTAEILGAFAIGIVLAATYRMSKSITPCILAHVLYNAMAIAFMRLFA